MEIFIYIFTNIITNKKRFQKKFYIYPEAGSSTLALGHTFASL